MDKYINAISKDVFGEIPLQITRKAIGICNEVFELTLKTNSYILRINKEKNILYGTHTFLPLFQKLHITTPRILAEDYSKTRFTFCYQILTKIEGEDLGLIINTLRPIQLKQIALEVSKIFDKFNTLPTKNDFGAITGLHEESYTTLFEVLQHQRKIILERNSQTKVIDEETIDILEILLEQYKSYFLQVAPKLYYDDICSKNVMIHNGKFTGLVDLDFLRKGDYLEAIGSITASWFGEASGEIYVNEIIRLQNLDAFQRKVVKVYAILTLIYWTSEAGICFNNNTSGSINWSDVKHKKKKIMGLFNKIKA